MSIALVLEMAVAADPDRVAIVDRGARFTTASLAGIADGGAAILGATGARHVAYLGVGGVLLPALLFASARAGIPFTPLNYRLSSDALAAQIGRLGEVVLVVDEDYRAAVAGLNLRAMTSEDFMAKASHGVGIARNADAEDVSTVLFTSGTTSRPKAVELTHNNLLSYVMGTVDFDSASPDDAVLISVPPYHIAGVGAALSNLYAGRKMVYLPRFDARDWVRHVVDERITTATLVPTMLDRIVTFLEAEPTPLPTLRNLAYGGSKVPLPLVRRALEALPEVGLVNAYGLTETSSTIAVLTPEDHRLAYQADTPAEARRLGSVGRAVPGVELQIRDEDGNVLGPGETGELFVRGAQVAGRYAEFGSVLDTDGWFGTRDHASIDADGYLFITGRSDDTIIRGGENIAPAELEDVLVEHPDVSAVAVVGVEDAHWGQIIVAVVVPAPGAQPDAEALRDYVRQALRGSRTPDRIVFRPHLPTTDTGKVLRRRLIDELAINSQS